MNKADLEIDLAELVLAFKESNDLDFKLIVAQTFILLKSKYIHLFQDNIEGGVPEQEVWANCKGWENIYQVSNFGRIKGHEAFFIKTTKGRTMAVYKPERIRSRRLRRSGYVSTSFWLQEEVKHYLVHRLVAIHFVPNPKKYKQVLHIDDDPGNPYFKNLKWGTQKHNIQDCVAKGRWPIGPKNNKTKLKESDIPKIRALLSQSVGVNKIGRIFGVTKCAIQMIRDGKTWKHIKV